MMMPPKERKYVECFKSNRDGSCNWCGKRSWKAGYKIYAMKTEEGRWIACTDKKCYTEQGGKLTVFHNDTDAESVPIPPIPKQYDCINSQILRMLDNHEKRLARIESVLRVTGIQMKKI